MVFKHILRENHFQQPDIQVKCYLGQCIALSNKNRDICMHFRNHVNDKVKAINRILRQANADKIIIY